RARGRPARAPSTSGRARAALAAGGGEGRPRRLQLRQRRDARGPRRVRRRRDRQTDGVRRLFAMIVLAAGVLLAVALVQEGKPGWWERLWYPLRYDQIVRGHARNYDLDPALLAAVIYQESKFKADARSKSGAIGLMQLLPDTAEGIALHTGG